MSTSQDPLLAHQQPSDEEGSRGDDEPSSFNSRRGQARGGVTSQHPYNAPGGRQSAMSEYRRRGREVLASRKKHFLVMAIVALDAVALLANIFLQLIACEMDQADEPWVENVSSLLETLGLVFSSLFMLELATCLFSFGLSFLTTPFHLFDAGVIILSFVIDVAAQGLTESIGSLVVILRLWRLAKLSEEVVMGATEQLEILEQELASLEEENKRLREQSGL